MLNNVIIVSQENQEVLIDVKNGKIIPWREKKQRSLQIASSYQRLGFEKKNDRICTCGDLLEFAINSMTNEKRLKSAYFCRERLCSMCQWRKSLKIFHELSNVIDVYKARNEKSHCLFLTLTVKNCQFDKLAETLDIMFRGWKNLINQRQIKKSIHGWFRSLEVTYNKVTNEFHPHLHVLMMVKDEYFQNDYIDIYHWVDLWQRSANLDYNPICHIVKVKQNKRKKSIYAELSKYTVKDTEIVSDDTKQMDKLIEVLTYALKGRRLYAYGFELKKIAKELQVDDVELGDLIKIGDDVRTDVFDMIVIYKWNIGLNNYYKIDNS